MEETGVINVADPLGGSWYVEALTDRMEAEAEHIFTRIRDLAALAVPSGQHPIGEMTSGILRGIEDGYFTGEIADAAFAYAHRGREGREEDGRGQLPRRRRRRRPGDPADLGRGGDRSRTPLLARRRRAARDDALVRATAARSWSRPPAVTATWCRRCWRPCGPRRRSGEICDALRDLWGVYTEPARI